MSSDEALARRARNLSALAADRQAAVAQADAFVVVSWWRDKLVASKGSYDYEHLPTLNDALDAYREYEDGQHERARAVGIFAVRNGMPVGAPLTPYRIAQLLQETRAA